MPLHRISSAKYSRGFTFIELLVVLSLVAFLGAIGSVASLNMISRSSLANERDLLVSLLSTARTQALANIDETAHGVHIDVTSFTVFPGVVFDPSDIKNRSVPRSQALTVTGPTDIVFAQLSGNVLSGVGSILLEESGASESVLVNEAGGLEW
jgi:prepilin-type N-terminal cleavage/methylation domain-containing protein